MSQSRREFLGRAGLAGVAALSVKSSRVLAQNRAGQEARIVQKCSTSVTKRAGTAQGSRSLGARLKNPVGPWNT